MKRILVVDDDPILHMLIDRELKRYDIKTTNIFTAVEALHQIKHRHFDFAFVDLMLGSMEGTQLVNALEGVRNGTRFYIISGVLEHAVSMIKRSGARVDGVIGKEVVVEKLKELLSSELKGVA